MAVIQTIYQHFGLTLSDQARARMLERISAAPEARHGEHRYSAETYGLDPDRVNQRFAPYIQRQALA
ncbi:hypothetical protein SB759_31310, partial [Pseudomonas sp. SIMBA_059]